MTKEIQNPDIKTIKTLTSSCLRTANHELRTVDNVIGEMVRAKAVMAPMSGVTDIPFRLMVRRYGCKFAFTEMIDVNGILYKNRKTYELMERIPEDLPLGVQIVGEDERKISYVAAFCEEKGFRVLDINAGCPARKVVTPGKGSALLKDPRKLASIVKRLVKERNIPITVKIRSGWSSDNPNYIEVAKALEDAGAASICMHSRTRDQFYRGKADHEATRLLKEAVRIPVFASGNIFSAQDAADAIAQTGCDGVFVARGALGNPWIFKNINDHFNGVPFEEKRGFEEIKDIMIEHFELCAEHCDERRMISRMYKHVTWYLKGYKGLNEVMKEYQALESLEEVNGFIERLALDGRHLCLS